MLTVSLAMRFLSTHGQSPPGFARTVEMRGLDFLSDIRRPFNRSLKRKRDAL